MDSQELMALKECPEDQVSLVSRVTKVLMGKEEIMDQMDHMESLEKRGQMVVQASKGYLVMSEAMGQLDILEFREKLEFLVKKVQKVKRVNKDYEVKEVTRDMLGRREMKVHQDLLE